MIVFGTRGKVIRGPRRHGPACANCGQVEHATAGVLRYFHVFWIPIFPTGKVPVLECLHCKKALTGKEIPEPARRQVADAVFTRGRVLPMFTGLAVLVALVAFAGITGAERSRQEAVYLAAPAAGDVYVVKLAGFLKNADPRHPYGVVRVKSVGAGSVEAELGSFGYQSLLGAGRAIRERQIEQAGYFTDERVAIPVAELQRYKARGVIASAVRP